MPFGPQGGARLVEVVLADQQVVRVVGGDEEDRDAAAASGDASAAATPVMAKSSGPATRMHRNPRSACTSSGTACCGQTIDSS